MIPEWEIDMLLRGIRRELAGPETAAPATPQRTATGRARDPWAAVPTGLNRLRLED